MERGAAGLRWLRNAALGAAGLLLAGALLRSATLPTPAGGERAEYARLHPAAYDTLLVGSSRTARQLSPEIFDRAMAERHVPTRSYNLGLAGLWPPEDGYLIERTLAGREIPLRFLVVECNPIRLGLPAEVQGSARAVHWHDTARMRVLWHRAKAQSADATKKKTRGKAIRRALPALSVHARHWLWNSLRLGRGAELLHGALEAREPARDDAIGPRGDGFRPLSPDKPALAGAALAEYEMELADTPAGARRLQRGDTESQAELRRKRELAARYGAELVLVAPPVPGRTFQPLLAPGEIFLDFADPERFPVLFAPEHRQDASHLNVRGAEIYSRELGLALAAILAERSG
jgi:hypothetical protein